MGEEKMNMNLGIIFLLIFFPILFPFSPAVVYLYVVLFIDDFGNIPEDERYLLRFPAIIFILAVVLSPIVMALCLGFGILGIGLSIGAEIAPYKTNQNLCWGLFLLIFIFSVAGVIIILCGLGIALAFVAAPLIGLGLLSCKIVYLTCLRNRSLE